MVIRHTLVVGGGSPAVGGTKTSTPIQKKRRSSSRSSSSSRGTAQFDASRGGVVTSDGRFFPTSNPNFTPSGYTKVAPKTTTTPLPSVSGSRVVPSGRVDARGQPIMIPFRETTEFKQAQPITRTQRTQAQRLGLSDEQIDTIVSRQGQGFLNQIIRKGQLREAGFYDAKQKRRIQELTRRASSPQEAQALLRAVTRPSEALERKTKRDIFRIPRAEARTPAEVEALVRSSTKISPGIKKKLESLLIKNLPYLSFKDQFALRAVLADRKAREELKKAGRTYTIKVGGITIIRIRRGNKIEYYINRKGSNTLTFRREMILPDLKRTIDKVDRSVRANGGWVNYGKRVLKEGAWEGFAKPVFNLAMKFLSAASTAQQETRINKQRLALALRQAKDGTLTPENKKRLEEVNKLSKELKKQRTLTPEERKLVTFMVILTASALASPIAGTIIGTGFIVLRFLDTLKNPTAKNIGSFLAMVGVSALFKLSKLKGKQKTQTVNKLKKTESQLNARLTKLEKRLLTTKKQSQIKSLQASITALKRAISRVKVTRLHINKPLTKAEFTKQLETLKRQITRTKARRVDAIKGTKLKDVAKREIKFIREDISRLSKQLKQDVTKFTLKQRNNIIKKYNTSLQKIRSLRVRLTPRRLYIDLQNTIGKLQTKLIRLKKNVDSFKTTTKKTIAEKYFKGKVTVLKITQRLKTIQTTIKNKLLRTKGITKKSIRDAKRYLKEVKAYRASNFYKSLKKASKRKINNLIKQIEVDIRQLISKTGLKVTKSLRRLEIIKNTVKNKLLRTKGITKKSIRDAKRYLKEVKAYRASNFYKSLKKASKRKVNNTLRQIEADIKSFLARSGLKVTEKLRRVEAVTRRKVSDIKTRLQQPSRILKNVKTSLNRLNNNIKLIKTNLKFDIKTKLPRAVATRYKSLLQKANKLKISFNRVVSKRIRDVRKIERLISQERSIAKQIIDLKKLKIKPIKQRVTFKSRRITRAKSAIRKIVGRKSVRTLTKAQRNALTKKYGKITFDEALRELASARIARKILAKKRVSALRRALKVKKPLPTKKTIQQKAIERVRARQQATATKVQLSQRTITVKDIIKEPPIGTNQVTTVSKQGTVQVLKTVSKTKKIVKNVRPVKLLKKLKVKVRQVPRLQLLIRTEQNQKFKFVVPENRFKTIMASILLNRQRIISKVASKQDVSMDALQSVGTVSKQEVAQATDFDVRQIQDVMPDKITLPKLKRKLKLRIPTITKKIPIIDIPEVPTDWTKKQLTKRYKKFDVYLKKRGARRPYMRANSGWMTFNDARNFGRYVSDNTPMASYQITPSKAVGKRQKFKATAPSKKFRRVKAKSKLPRKTVVERRKYRMDTVGEKRGISIKGLRRLRNQKNILNLIKGKKQKKIKRIIRKRAKRGKRR